MIISVSAEYAKLKEDYMSVEEVVNYQEKELKEVKAKLAKLEEKVQKLRKWALG